VQSGESNPQQLIQPGGISGTQKGARLRLSPKMQYGAMPGISPKPDFEDRQYGNSKFFS
jgi:hypothetical protein